MDIQTLIDEIEAYAAQRGVKPGTVCREAAGHFYLYDRLKRRAERIEKDAARLREYMASNPVTPDGLACGTHDAPPETDCQQTENKGA